MLVKIVPAIGPESPYDMEVDPDEDIGSLKKRVAKQCGVPASALTLTCRGIELQDENSTLGSLGIQDGDKIFYVSSDIEGGL
ncbi:MAG: ubiquitin-like domain-containing protein [Candidatus Lokiarchaeia archaeon]